MERASSQPADVHLCKKVELKASVDPPAGNRCTCSRVVLTLERWSLDPVPPPPHSPELKAAEEVQWPRHST